MNCDTDSLEIGLIFLVVRTSKKQRDPGNVSTEVQAPEAADLANDTVMLHS